LKNGLLRSSADNKHSGLIGATTACSLLILFFFSSLTAFDKSTKGIGLIG
jgi:hypothetical protein